LPDASLSQSNLLSAEISPITRLSNKPEAYRMQDPLKTLKQIAFGQVILPSGKARQMYNYEIINLAREACDQLGVAYSNGACKPLEARSEPNNAFGARSTG
jgi:hypothetical protein